MSEYCSYCGKELTKSFIQHDYHHKTGEPRFIKTVTCPDKKWYNFHTRESSGGYVGTSAIDQDWLYEYKTMKEWNKEEGE